jgi:ABC-type glycerol-3-phosphate transport system substrate-binding protein
MKRLVLALAVIVAALGLVACGGGGSSSTDSTSSTGSDSGGSVDPAEVAEGVALWHEHERLEGLINKGIHRMAMAQEYGTKVEVESLEEAEAEIRKEDEAVFAELNEEPEAVQRAVLKQIHSEK